MEKEFNDTGSCYPELNYMVNIDGKVSEIVKLIEKKKYFTINRPRQFGKSTILGRLELQLPKDGYYVISLTFESMSAIDFHNEKNFIREFLRQLKRIFRYRKHQELVDFVENRRELDTFGQLDDFLTGFTELIGKPTVLLIDEVDKSLNNQLFLNFLGLLRSKYLLRSTYPTFHSIILAGVYDVKTLKLKLLPGDERKYNSPWNIAADFNVDFNFKSPEIETMLAEYAREKPNTSVQTNAPALSERLYYFTSGHPFLVSKLCKIIDEQLLPERENKNWTVEDIDQAFEMLVSESYSTTNFDDMDKNLENHPKLYKLVSDIIMDGKRLTFNVGNPLIKLGAMFGILVNSKEGDGAVIHNKVYEQRIYNYMSSKIETSTTMEGYNHRENFITQDNQLDFEAILLKFQEFMKFQHSRKDIKFLEKDGRLVFLAFLKPIINGRGFHFKEVRTSEEKRLDVVVTYMNRKYIVELKKWYGNEYHKKGVVQLADYLQRQNLPKGYLLIFDFRSRKKVWKKDVIKSKGKDIFVVWV
ncbi:MAG: AAA family ATPase [bacterium]|nr:AAA family ATPase [bacterium]